MRKTATRIYALFLALCLILPAGIVSPVQAAEEQNVAAQTVELFYDSSELTFGTSGGAQYFSEKHLAIFKSAYASNTIRFIPVAYQNDDSTADTSDDRFATPWMYTSSKQTDEKTRYNFSGQKFDNEKYEWIAYKIKSPGNGNFQVALNYFAFDQNTQNGAVYVLPASLDTGSIDTTKTNITAALTEESYTHLGTVNMRGSADKADALYNCQKILSEPLSKSLLETKAEEDFVIVFQSLSNGRLWLSGISMTPVIAVGETNYTSLSKAFTAAQESETKKVTLLADRTENEIVVPAGVTLDLNGFTLTATEISSAGSIIDSSAESTGVLQGALTASGDNGGYLPVSAGENTYKFYKVTVTASTAQTNAANSAKLKFQVKFENNAAYDALAKGTSDATIGGSFAWAANTTPTMHDITYEGATLAEKWGKAVIANDYADGSIVLSFSGLDAFEDLSVAPYIRNEETGVTISVDAVTLN